MEFEIGDVVRVLPTGQLGKISHKEWHTGRCREEFRVVLAEDWNADVALTLGPYRRYELELDSTWYNQITLKEALGIKDEI